MYKSLVVISGLWGSFPLLFPSFLRFLLLSTLVLISFDIVGVCRDFSNPFEGFLTGSSEYSHTSTGRTSLPPLQPAGPSIRESAPLNACYIHWLSCSFLICFFPLGPPTRFFWSRGWALHPLLCSLPSTCPSFLCPPPANSFVPTHLCLYMRHPAWSFWSPMCPIWIHPSTHTLIPPSFLSIHYPLCSFGIPSGPCTLNNSI